MEIGDVYILYVKPHFSNAGMVLCNVDGISVGCFKNVVTTGNGH